MKLHSTMIGRVLPHIVACRAVEWKDNFWMAHINRVTRLVNNGQVFAHLLALSWPSESKNIYRCRPTNWWMSIFFIILLPQKLMNKHMINNIILISPIKIYIDVDQQKEWQQKEGASLLKQSNYCSGGTCWSFQAWLSFKS